MSVFIASVFIIVLALIFTAVVDRGTPISKLNQYFQAPAEFRSRILKTLNFLPDFKVFLKTAMNSALKVINSTQSKILYKVVMH